MNDVISVFLQPVIELVPKIPGAILTLLIGYLVIRVITFFLRRALKFMRLTPAVKSLLVSLLIATYWAFLTVLILNYMGLGSVVVALTGSAVLVGFVLNNGLSQTITDIFAGISLSGDRDFKVGNRISINEDKIVGEVTSMTTRKVKLVDDDGKLHVIPNSMFDKNEWIILAQKEKVNASHKSKK